MNLKYKLLYAIIIVSVLLHSCTTIFEKQNPVNDFDKTTGQKPVYSYDGIDSVLGKFEIVKYSEIEKSKYAKYSFSDRLVYKTFLKNRSYFIIKGTDIYYYLVGKFRIKDFLSKDKYYGKNIKEIEKSHIQYFLVDKRILYKTLDVIIELKENNYNYEAFIIKDGHRNPRYNVSKGGASKSRHMYGDAVDIYVGDVNKDGKYTKDDKDIIYKMLNKKIIAYNGGIGRYPGSRVLHYDVRGYRARW